MTYTSRRWAPAALLLLAITAALTGASMPPAAADSGSGATLTGQAVVTPNNFSATLQAVVPVPPGQAANLSGLDGGLEFTFNRSTCTLTLSGYLHLSSPSMNTTDSSNLTASSSGHFEFEASIAGGNVSYTYTTTSSLELHSVTQSGGSASTVDLTGSVERSVSGVMAPGGVAESSGATSASLQASIVSPNGSATIQATLNTQGQSVGRPNQTAGSGAFQGDLNLESGEFQLAVSYDGNYTYNITAGDGEAQAEVEATVNFHFTDYLTAIAFYTLLTQIVENLSISDYVTVLPPSFSNPTVTVIVSYQGSLTGLEPGAGYNMTLNLPGWLRGLIPSQPPMLNGSIGVTGNYTASLTGTNDELNASLEAVAQASGILCNCSYGLSSGSLNITYTGSEAVIDAHIEGYSAEPYTSGILASRALGSMINASEDNLSSVLVTLAGGDGVEFYLDGESLSSATFTLENYTLLNNIGVSYAGATLMDVGGLLEVGPNVSSITIPPIAGGVSIQGATSINLTAPFAIAPRDLVVAFHNAIASNATLLIRAGTSIQGQIHVETLDVGSVEVPPNLGVPAGPSLLVTGVAGNVTVKLPFTGTGQGQPALYVVHSNGETEVITDVTVEDGYLIANATASTSYTPIELSGQPPGGGTTTSTSGTGGATSTTSTAPSTTTGTQGVTTTSQPGTTTTPHTPPATSAPTSTSPSGRTTTGTTPETTTGETGGTSSPETTHSTTAGGGGTSKTAAIAGLVIVIILVAAAYALMRR